MLLRSEGPRASARMAFWHAHPGALPQIIALKEAGVDEVILAINYKPDVMAAFIQEWSQKLNIKARLYCACGGHLGWLLWGELTVNAMSV